MRAICCGLAFAFVFAVITHHPAASTPDHVTTLIRKK
jgi:hypothetical protein